MLSIYIGSLSKKERASSWRLSMHSVNYGSVRKKTASYCTFDFGWMRPTMAKVATGVFENIIVTISSNIGDSATET